jgi:hypothetical protein
MMDQINVVDFEMVVEVEAVVLIPMIYEQVMVMLLK